MPAVGKARGDPLRIVLALTAILFIGAIYAMAVELAVLDRFLDGIPTFKTTLPRIG